MFSNLVPVNKERHEKTKIKQIKGFQFASAFHIASVMAHEFVRAAAIYPIVFLEDKEKDEFIPVALMGLEEGKNLFVDDAGKWQASYIPAIVRRYPFALAKGEKEGQFTVCIDEGSELINEKEGEGLFEKEGKPTKVLEDVKKYLGELQQMEVFTKDLCRFFAEKNMFTPFNMRVRDSQNVKSIAGCYVLNEERLNNLSDEGFLEIRKKGYLPAIYAHLTSLAQIERLVMLKQGETGLDKVDTENGRPDVVH